MTFLASLVLYAVTTFLLHVGKPKTRREKPRDLERVDAEEGKPIPLVYGIAALTPNIIAWGETETGVDIQGGFPGTFYYAKMVGLLAQGPIDQFVDLQIAGKSLMLWPLTKACGPASWEDRPNDLSGDEDGLYPLGTATPAAVLLDASDDSAITGPIDRPADGQSTTLIVTALNLMGGLREQGGVVGPVTIHWGADTETVADPTYAALLEADGTLRASTLPHQVHLAFGLPSDAALPDGVPPRGQFYWGANTGAMPSVVALVRCIPHGLLDLDLDADYTSDGLSEAECIAAASIAHDANPAEVIYDLCTHPVRGAGRASARYDTAQLVAAAKTLRGEGRGISLQLTGEEEIDEVIADICRTIHAIWRRSPTTGLWQLKLLRNDYTVSDLVLLDTTNTRGPRLVPGTPAQQYNEVRATFRRFDVVAREPLTGQLVTESVPESNFHFVYLQLQHRNVSEVVLYYDEKEGDGPQPVDTDDYELVSPANGIIRLDTLGQVESGDRITADYISAAAFQGYVEGITSPAQDLANVLMTGTIRPQTIDLPYFTTELNAAWGAGVELRRQVQPATLALEVNRQGYALAPGDAVVAYYPHLGLARPVVFRVVGEIDYGRLTEGWIGVTLAEDLWAKSVAIPLPGDTTTGVTPSQGTAPAVYLGQAATSAIRVCLYPSDDTFSVELQRATDAVGTGATTLSATILGTAGFYDDAQTVGDTRYYRARLVRSGWTAGAWTPWTAMTAEAGTPGACTCTVPWVTLEASETSTLGTLTVVVNDPQRRTVGVWFQTKVGLAAASAWTEDAAAPYTATVARSGLTVSTISYRVKYTDCAGEPQTLEGTVSFPLPSYTVVVGADTVVVGADPVVVTPF